MLNKKINKNIAIAMSSIMIALPITNTASAMERTLKTPNKVVVSTEKQLMRSLIKDLEREGFNVNGFINEVNKVKFNDLTSIEPGSTQAYSLGSTALKTAAKWLKTNITKLTKLISKYLGINILGSKLIEYIDVFVGISDSIDDLIYRLVRKVAPKSWKNSTCEKWAKVIRLALPI